MPLFDTNVLIIATLGPDPGLQAATIEMLREESEVLLPAYWAYEFVGVVTRLTHLNNENRISKETARTAFRTATAYETSRIEGGQHAEVLEVALRYDCSGYDAQFIYWAIELNTPLITDDKKLANTVPAHTRRLRDYLNQR